MRSLLGLFLVSVPYPPLLLILGVLKVPSPSCLHTAGADVLSFEVKEMKRIQDTGTKDTSNA